MVIFSEKLKEKSIPFLLHPKLVVVIIDISIFIKSFRSSPCFLA